jgi:hypothetical protein
LSTVWKFWTKGVNLGFVITTSFLSCYQLIIWSKLSQNSLTLPLPLGWCEEISKTASSKITWFPFCLINSVSRSTYIIWFFKIMSAYICKLHIR